MLPIHGGKHASLAQKQLPLADPFGPGNGGEKLLRPSCRHSDARRERQVQVFFAGILPLADALCHFIGCFQQAAARVVCQHQQLGIARRNRCAGELCADDLAADILDRIAHQVGVAFLAPADAHRHGQQVLGLQGQVHARKILLQALPRGRLCAAGVFQPLTAQGGQAAAVARTFGDLLFPLGLLFLPAGLFLGDKALHLVQVHRLGQILHHAKADALPRIGEIIIAGQQHDPHLGVNGAQALGKLHAGHDRHTDIGDDQRRGMLHTVGHCLRRAEKAVNADLHRLPVNGAGQAFDHLPLIVNENQFKHLRCSPCFFVF